MKKYIVFIIVIALGLGMLQNIQAQENETYLMKLPSFNININGAEVDHLHNRNPILVYNDITYVPITSEYSGALLFESRWDDEKGLIIVTNIGSGKLIQDKSVNNDRDKCYKAVKPSFDVYLNGRLINNESSKYPILVYEGITYLPLIKEYLDKDFDVALTWSEDAGLSIISKSDDKNSIVNLNNEILEGAVRDKLSKSNGVLTKSDIESIRVLSLSNKKLSSLEGIENLINIEELYLDNNNIVEIDKLKELTKLKVLHLQRNFISDISPLQYLTELQELSLNGNRVLSLKALGGLINLRNLYFTENNITDISPLRGLENIEALYMKYGNKIQDYSPIAGYYENIIDKDFSLTEEELENFLSSDNRPLLSIAELIDEAKYREKDKLRLNGYYAISSNYQYNDFKKDGSISAFDSISFGWAFVDYDSKTGKSFININDSTNDFYIPEGYKDPVDYMKKENIDTNINIYASRNYDELFTNSNELIEQIVTLLRGKNESYPELSLSGVVIDFEMLPDEHNENYIKFLIQLDKELTKYHKNLVVAVSPLSSYDLGRIVEIADNVILMLHDYDIKNGNNLLVIDEKVDNPNTPIERIKGDLIDILNGIDREKYISKLWLQINFSINQWKVNDGTIVNQAPYTPRYDVLVKRIDSEIESGKNLENVIEYSNIYQNPYMVYSENGITSSIWYEDDRSVSAKIQLAKDLGLGGISLWRIGNIPDYRSDIYLDTWNVIRKLIK